MPKSALTSFLNEVAEVLEAFSIETSSRKGSPEPRALLISFIALAVAASFSRGVYPPIIALATAILLSRALGVKLKRMAKAAALISMFILAVTLPMALYQAYLDQAPLSDSSALLWGLAPLLLRCVAATSALVLMTQSLGLMGLIRALRGLRVPPRALLILVLFLRYIPIMLRDTIKLLSAREVRMVSSSVKDHWLMLSTVASGLLIKGFERAYRLQMAFKARGLDPSFIPAPNVRAGPLDLALVALSSTLACLLVLM